MTVYVTEYKSAGADGNLQQVQIAKEPALTGQTVTPDATGVQSSAFNASTTIIRVATDAAVLVGAGSSPAGADAHAYLAAGTAEYFAVVGGHKLIAKTA